MRDIPKNGFLKAHWLLYVIMNGQETSANLKKLSEMLLFSRMEA